MGATYSSTLLESNTSCPEPTPCPSCFVYEDETEFDHTHFHFIKAYSLFHPLISLKTADKEEMLKVNFLLIPRTFNWKMNLANTEENVDKKEDTIKIFLDDNKIIVSSMTMKELDHSTALFLRMIKDVLSKSYETDIVSDFGVIAGKLYSSYYIVPIPVDDLTPITIMFNDKPESSTVFTTCDLRRPCFKIPMKLSVLEDDKTSVIKGNDIYFIKTIKEIEEDKAGSQTVANRLMTGIKSIFSFNK